jgi:hypothetical protein
VEGLAVGERLSVGDIDSVPDGSLVFRPSDRGRDWHPANPTVHSPNAVRRSLRRVDPGSEGGVIWVAGDVPSVVNPLWADRTVEKVNPGVQRITVR